jgi:hypothetical protein
VRHLRAVPTGASPETEAEAMGQVLERLNTPTVSVVDSAPATFSWSTVLGIELPPGVPRHPRLLGPLREQLGRRFLLDNRQDGVRVSFTAHGTSYEEAVVDAAGVADALLQMLGLPRHALVEQRLYAADELLAASEDSPPALPKLR